METQDTQDKKHKQKAAKWNALEFLLKLNPGLSPNRSCKERGVGGVTRLQSGERSTKAGAGFCSIQAGAHHRCGLLGDGKDTADEAAATNLIGWHPEQHRLSAAFSCK
jgi:hypothetical protein